jgi:hypothetical protein
MRGQTCRSAPPELNTAECDVLTPDVLTPDVLNATCRSLPPIKDDMKQWCRPGQCRLPSDDLSLTLIGD